MTKKSFKGTAGESPAASYITITQTSKGDISKLELKTKRLNLLIRPSVRCDIQKIATMQRKSVNEIINQALIEYANQHSDLISKYDVVFGKEGV